VWILLARDFVTASLLDEQDGRVRGGRVLDVGAIRIHGLAVAIERGVRKKYSSMVRVPDGHPVPLLADRAGVDRIWCRGCDGEGWHLC
jgi:hypothetical protein